MANMSLNKVKMLEQDPKIRNSNFNEVSLGYTEEMAKEEGIELTDKHFAVLKFIRENEASLTIRKVGNSGIVDIKGFYALFPGGPLKISSKIAGIRKPTSCV